MLSLKKKIDNLLYDYDPKFEKAPGPRQTTFGPSGPRPDKIGRDESKHITCITFSRANPNCIESCANCSVSIKTHADLALIYGDLDGAIHQYKMALASQPDYAEAWCNLGNAYGTKREYSDALSAFDKATSIDPTYGKALLGKAIVLRNLNELKQALMLIDEILALYNDASVIAFKNQLLAEIS